MAHRPHRKPPHHATRRRSASQIAAAKRWNAAGRKAALHKKRTPRQIASAKNNLAKARQHKKAIHSGHATRRTTAPAYDSPLVMDSLPVCAPVAFAESIYQQTGNVVDDETIIAIHEQVGIVTIIELIEYCLVNGFAGYELDSFYRCDEDQFISGLVYGLQVSTGYHAALSTAYGLLSWGMVWPVTIRPLEAWGLQWSETRQSLDRAEDGARAFGIARSHKDPYRIKGMA